MAQSWVFIAVLVLCTLGSDAVILRRGLEAEDSASLSNPIRKVLTMLQSMQTRVTEEGKKEEEAYDKFMCYCKTNGGQLTEAVEQATAKIESVASAIKQGSENKEQTEASLKEHQTSREEAKETIATASSLREKEAAAYSKVKSEYDQNIAALGKAVSALENGMAGAFLQTTASNVLKKYVMEKATMPDETREELLSFLSGTQGAGYMPQGGEITGILKQMEKEMSESLASFTSEEDSSITNYQELMAAKQKEVATVTEQIEAEMTRVGDLGVEIAGMKHDLEDTKASLSADTKFAMELETSCGSKTAEWEEIKKTRSEELVALAETIKVLNDDDALELFKKTLPSASASFVQLKTNRQAVLAKALNIISKASNKVDKPQLDLISLALKGKKIGFEKVIKMIDDMVTNLKSEQIDDDAKKDYCTKQFDETDDKKKGLELSISNSETAIEEAEGTLAALAEEIKGTEAGIKALDKSVAQATEIRKEENAEYKELMASNSQAKDVLGWAKNRLNKFYNPKLYAAPPKRELTEDAFVQYHRGAPPPAPETFGPYTKKSSETGGVIAMIDLLIRDLEKEMTEADVMEKDAQGEYEKVMAESSDKRAADSKALTQKGAMKASTEEALESEKESKAGSIQELMTTSEYIAALHEECDWLVQYYDERKEARASEVESLGNAKAVLSGADFSLLQRTSAFLARH